ncbi:HipA domain-containing protein [Paramuribaculum intestinale]|uniref:Type II toxin-antitoxin system HipA family toxin n=7 Tax=Bacteroidales TaxID=171549 RepID=A0A2V1J313_9BACT|nr:HipA domain-containing protein [Paramuribaculum intestinale]MBJ2186020.1 HipA domain-containing protein [Muribaculaceae bacterium]PWB09307.1 type II toxin-antitoxin system HipA family toxin [Paramuribaculum intestinale]ROS93620.1 type II toxin-antitoxin system HipA family toxin [Muribaculaceae bacterium Isolate-043 (Harlan)]WLT43330.1 HipA domain-containing protein [Paramuribaculum intestinale]
MMNCLYCYKPLADGEVDYHKSCARKIFESTTVPVLPYTRANIKELAREIVSASTTVTGAQAKLSLDITRGHAGEPQRFTIVGLWGRFILKPQTDRFANLPENEDLTMHLAEAAGIKTVPHSLIRFADGELCYITHRVDRTKNGDKIAMEDMCQLSERLTEDKYKGSYERIAKLIKQYSAAPLLDVVNFWEVVVFSWLTGNADMHLKNFSLYRPADNYMLTPAYDLLSTSIVMPEDDEELALTLNGKKKKIKRADFEKAMLDSGMDEKAIEKLFKKFAKTLPKWYALIEESFLPKDMMTAYREKLNTMSARLGLL